MKLIFRMVFVAATGVVLMVLTAGKPDTDFALKLLKNSGAVQYAQKQPYGGGLEEMLLGFDAAGKAVSGVGVRETATYEKTMTYILVVMDGDAFTIKSVEMPEVGTFKGKSRLYTETALKDITGKTLKKPADIRSLTDAVSGATPQLKAIYVSSGVMVSKIMKELKKVPDWKRRPLP